MKPLAPNTLIQNRYLLVQLIGKGGMGDVYLAVDQRLGSAVALKRTFFADDEMLGGAFEREAKILARLRHPVLPKVSDHFTENGEQFLVMEHISGDDLFKRLEVAKKPFPLSWVLFWADQLLDALSYLHTNEPPIIHRDIKPQNLKLTDENHIVLLDFGLSKNSAGETQFTNSGSVVGYTPHYAPMEQIRGMGTSPRSDIYALSATLYQLMSNTVPADALSRADALLNGQEDPIKPVFEVNPEIQPMVSDVILKGMEISQDKRWQSARDMQKALRDAFSEMQSAMAAQTQVFSMPQPPPAIAADQIPAAPPAEGIAAGADLDSAPARAEVSEFDATLRYDPSEKERAVEQALTVDAAETAAPGEEATSEREAAAPTGVMPTASDENGDFVSVPTAEVSAPAFLADANESAPSSPFATQIEGPGAGAEGASTGEPVESVPLTPVKAAPPQTRNLPPKKSSNAPLMIGGLLALLLLLGGVSVGGWFAYQKYYAAPVAESTPTPSPSATGTPSPTPVPVLEPASNGNSNIDVNGNVSTEPTPLTGEPGGTPKPVKPTPVKTAAKTPAPAKSVDRLKTEQ
jgi:hypothetical protein